MLGLMGDAPDTVDAGHDRARLETVRASRKLALLGTHEVPFVQKDHIAFYRQALAEHPNGMKLHAFDAQRRDVARGDVSVGGRRVCGDGGRIEHEGADRRRTIAVSVSQRQRIARAVRITGKTIAQLMWDNERVWRTEEETRAGLMQIWDVMQSCVARGCGIDNPDADGNLPGPFQVKRRAPQLYRALSGNPELALRDPLSMIDWINLYAIAVNEENAAGGRVVTAPTNGAAGIIPAVLHYYTRFMPGSNQQGVIDFLMTAAAIGILYKLNASISGAEVGCQGEVGVACSMAAGALAAVMGGTPKQVENAAEIGMEHNLGLTCDPVGGMVQIPCIERNAMGSVKAVNAARMAMRGDGSHYVSLDSVIKTMRETGADMKTKYKETSRGGLAVNIVEC